MITSVEVLDNSGGLRMRLPVLSLALGDPYVSKEIEGLGPVGADISTVPYPNHDGVVLQTSSIRARSIRFKIGYRPNYRVNQSVQTLRRDLYKYFSPKRMINIRFLSDDYLPVKISGIVEQHDPVLFAEEPEVQISVLCVDPNFRGNSEVVSSGFVETSMLVTNKGEAAGGFLFELTLLRSATAVTLSNGVDSSILFEYAFLKDDVLKISTVRGNKFITLKRGTTTSNVLDGLRSGTLTMGIGPDVNSFLAKVTGASNMAMPFRLTHTPRYIGV